MTKGGLKLKTQVEKEFGLSAKIKIEHSDYPLLLHYTDYDEVEDVLDRIILLLGTIPRYISLVNEERILPYEEVLRLPISELIGGKWSILSLKKIVESNPNPTESLKLILSELPHFNQLNRDDLLFGWLYYSNKSAGASPDELNSLVSSFIQEEILVRDKETTLSTIESEHRSFVNDCRVRFEAKDEISKISPIQHTSIQLINRHIRSKIHGLGGLNFFFRNLAITDNVPYARLYNDGIEAVTNEGVAKVRPEFLQHHLLSSFVNRLKEDVRSIHNYLAGSQFLHIKVKNTSRTLLDGLSIPDFHTIIIDEEFLHLITNEANMIQKSTDKLMEEVLDLLNIARNQVSTPELILCRGDFIFPLLTLQPFLLQDFVLLNKTFNHFVFMNEYSRVFRDRKNIFIYITLQHLNRKTGQSIEEKVMAKAYISPKFIASGDSSLQRRDPKRLRIGTHYVEVMIKDAMSIEALEKTHSLLSKLITSFHQEEEKIKKEYDSILHKSLPYIDVKKIENKPERLKDIDPLLFISGYQRACQAPPFVVDHLIEEKQRKKHLELIQEKKPVTGTIENKRYLLYPTDEKSHYYSCPSGSHIGLKLNILSNRDNYQFLPCCYKEDQLEKKRSHLNMFLHDVTIDRRKAQGYVFSTMRTLPIEEGAERYGILPENVMTVMKLATADNFVRSGVQQSRHSLFHAVISAINKEYGKMSVRKRNEIVQEFINEVDRLIPVPKKYQQGEFANIRHYNTYLEQVCGFRIYCFIYRPFIYPRGSLIGLNHSLSINNRCLILIENYGVENLKEPQYEVIVRMNEIGIHKETDGEISSHLATLEKMTNNITTHDLPEKMIKKYSTIIADSRGFVRQLNGDSFTVFTEPIPISQLSFDLLPKLSSTGSVIFADKALKSFDHPIAKLNDDNQQIGFLYDYGGDLALIPTTENQKSIKVIEETEPCPLNSPTNPKREKLSHLQSFLIQERKATILTEYFKFFFSHYIEKKKIERYGIRERIDDFVKDCIVIDPTIDYENRTLEFNQDEVFIVDGKLKIRDELILQRLIYLITMIPLDEIIKFKDRKFITIEGSGNYGQEVKDSVSVYIDTKNINSYSIDNSDLIMDDIVKDMVGKTNTTPTFFYYKGMIYIAQPARTLAHALHIAAFYRDTQSKDSDFKYSGINLGYDSEPAKSFDGGYTEVRYKRRGLYVEIPHLDERDLMIYSYKFGHRKDNIIRYGALLPYCKWEKRVEKTDVQKIIDDLFSLEKQIATSTTN